MMLLRNAIFKNKLLSRIALVVAGFLLWPGCKKLTDVGAPNNSMTSDNVYQNDATANSVVLGIYASIGGNTMVRAQSFNSLSLVAGLSADELTLFGGASNANAALARFYSNSLTSGSSTSTQPSIWNELYTKIYGTNLAIERLANSSQLNSSVKQQLTGEGKFLRAFFYFYLINLYGDVPLTITSDYRNNSMLARSSRSQVYQQIISDLEDAQDLLNENFVSVDGKSVSNERLRPNKYAARALLARVYLYMGNWSKAEELATQVINNSSKFNLTLLNETFLKNSNEAIWQLQPVNIGWNTEDARVFILPATGPTSNSTVDGYPVYISDRLLNVFEVNDQRKTSWMGSVNLTNSSGAVKYFFPYKYKNATLNASVTEYVMVLRLAEQYLIRAEARAMLENVSGSKSDIDAIRIRAGLDKTLANDKKSLLQAIQHERQVELFTEWGHRWLDLKRTNAIDSIMETVAKEKGGNWSTNWQWYPIPLYDIVQNGNIKQNLGY